MWRTPIGQRSLRGCEWDLFRQGLGMLRDQIEVSIDEPELCSTGVSVFDRLEPAAKLAMLALVGTALHDDSQPCPELTALTEGSFGAVYAMIRDVIEFEIEMGREDPEPESVEFSMRALASLHSVRRTRAGNRRSLSQIATIMAGRKWNLPRYRSQTPRTWKLGPIYSMNSWIASSGRTATLKRMNLSLTWTRKYAVRLRCSWGSTKIITRA